MQFAQMTIGTRPIWLSIIMNLSSGRLCTRYK